jgi:hypothetical protein
MQHTDREVFAGMSTSALFPCFSGVHGNAGIYQKIFQLNSLNQVRVPGIIGQETLK